MDSSKTTTPQLRCFDLKTQTAANRTRRHVVDLAAGGLEQQVHLRAFPQAQDTQLERAQRLVPTPPQ